MGFFSFIQGAAKPVDENTSAFTNKELIHVTKTADPASGISQWTNVNQGKATVGKPCFSSTHTATNFRWPPGCSLVSGMFSSS
ncbi:MAG: hypothetical protein CSB22_00010 [Deltaproteobacteria bacterium]|nr:MAG: hypothetical protein CSB22_00010 [Deltaproteobacteria bacterium]